MTYKVCLQAFLQQYSNDYIDGKKYLPLKRTDLEHRGTLNSNNIVKWLSQKCHGHLSNASDPQCITFAENISYEANTRKKHYPENTTKIGLSLCLLCDSMHDCTFWCSNNLTNRLLTEFVQVENCTIYVSWEGFFDIFQ